MLVVLASCITFLFLPYHSCTPLEPHRVTTASTRDMDPVVFVGLDVPSLLGMDCVSTLVAFSWRGGQWIQIPIQVDERHVVDWYTVKGNECRLYNRNRTEVVYADAGTYSGPDQDALLDEDDEIVLMAKEVGEEEMGESYPEGVLDQVKIKLEVLDDTVKGSLGFVYLFVSDGSLEQGAGAQDVYYKFKLTATNEEGSNDYFDVYNFGASHIGFEDDSVENKEDSFFESKFYRRHFVENWNYDALNIFSGNSTGEDIMAHQDFQFIMFDCSRSVNSFTHGGTAFIANKMGPVRAIRSWVGANSGTITQRESIFYPQREELRTFLRVHSIPGLMDYITYKEDIPLTFYNCHNKQGIKIDGVHEGDDFQSDYCPWEFVTGRAGSLLRSTTIAQDLADWMHVPHVNEAFFLHSWFYDNRVPESVDDDGVAIHPDGVRNWHQCSTQLTDQKAAWGTHGLKLKTGLPGIPNTDPNRHILFDESFPQDCDPVEPIEPWIYHFTMTNNYYYLEPGLDVDTAETLHLGAQTPLSVKVHIK